LMYVFLCYFNKGKFHSNPNSQLHVSARHTKAERNRLVENKPPRKLTLQKKKGL
jgi:hypothetical protein